MRFNSGTSEFFDWFITKGIAGAMILLVFIGVAIGVTVQMLMRQRQEQDHATQSLEIGLFVALLVGIGSLALYPASFMLWFVFWLLMGSLGFLARRSSRVLSFSSGHSFLALGSSLALLTILISVVSLLLVGGQKYYAEMMYFKGVNASRQGNVEEAITKISQAADLNPSVDIYWRGLAQLYVAKTNQLASDQTLPPDARQQEVGTTARKAIESAKRATERNPADVANWNVRGFVHRSLIGVPGEAEKAIESYKKAQELEPVSPFPWTELGRVKVLQAEILAGHGGSIEQRQQLIESALEDLKRAIELKRDYAPAHYLMAIAQDQQGNRQGAIAKLEETKLVAPNDIGLAFQLGVLYWRQNELGKALDEFERAKALNSRYSNVRYMLGLVYDALGRKEEAKTEFAIVSLLNPQNQEVKNILANLAAGLPALAGIGQPGTPPIQENPREIEQGE